MSKEGIIKLENELKNLKTVERPRLIAEIKRAMELGDLSENAEYHAAKEAQSHLERKIADGWKTRPVEQVCAVGSGSDG